MFRRCRQKQSDNDSDSEDESSTPIERRKSFRDEEPTDIEIIPNSDISADDEQKITKALESSAFIMALASKAIKSFAKYMTPDEVLESEVIIHQNDEGDSIYVSKSGKFKIMIDNEEISQFEDCRVFGELAILYDKPRLATVIAESDGLVWKLSRVDFKAILNAFNITAYRNLIEFLGKVHVLNGLSEAKLKKIADLCETKYYPKDTEIVKENDRGDEFFIMKTGSVAISQSEQGLIKTLDQPGDYFGERALIHDDDKRQATIIAGEYGVECIILSRNDFNEFLGGFHNFFDNDDHVHKANLNVEVPNKSQVRNNKYDYIELDTVRKLRQLGEGSFGIVDLVICSRNQPFALKAMEKKKLQQHNLVKNAFNEKKIMRLCNNPFILKLFRTFEDNKNYYFLLEYCPFGDLFSLLYKSRSVFKETHAKFTAACIAEALIYLHERHCAFLDLKPENICIDKNFYPKLLDFGNAVQLEPGTKHFIPGGTLDYMAPEISKLTGYDMAADYWALGVLIYELHAKRTPFINKDEVVMAMNAAAGITSHHLQRFKKPASDIITRLMNLNPAKRLGCQVDGGNEIRKHEFFGDIDFVKLNEYRLKSPLRKLIKR